VAKILKQLARGGLLLSQRGAGGGYSLAKRSREVSVAEILQVMHESVGLVDCSPGVQRTCSHETGCPMKDPLWRLNAVVVRALESLTLRELVA
jgi:Rrf2 family protein